VSLCRSQSTATMSRATFIMSNMVPNPDVNRLAWEHLESYCRELVQHEGRHSMSFVALSARAVKAQGLQKIIGTKNKVTVPSKCWKVIMVMDTAR